MSASGITFFSAPTKNLNAATASIISAIRINMLIMLMDVCFIVYFIMISII